MGIVDYILGAPETSEEQRRAAITRITSDPGIPESELSTNPFWLRDPHPLAKSCSKILPQEVDIIIIGSGVTAASVAREIYQQYDCATKPKVVVLEARDLCSGATGRNGGHCNASGFESYPELVEACGKETAAKLTAFRLGHLPLMLRVAEEDGLLEASQMRIVESAFVFFDASRFEESKKALALFRHDMPMEANKYKLIEAEEARRELCMPDICGAITYPAGALWPYRLIGGIFEKLQEKHSDNFFLETNTAVTGISPPNADISRYSVITTRGTILAKHIVHATNAHAAHLIPGLKGRIVPVRGHMSAQKPGSSLPDFSDRSWSFIYANGFDYVTQLPQKNSDRGDSHQGGEIMIGGGVAQAIGKGIEDMGVATDGLPFNLHTRIHLAGVLRGVFAEDCWGSEQGQAIKSMWTGNMGFTKDNVPFVGKLPQSLTQRDASNTDNAEWIAAGYNGEGMVHAWRSGIAVAQMIMEGMDAGKKFGWEQWLPEQLLVTEERIKNTAFQPPTIASG